MKKFLEALPIICFAVGALVIVALLGASIYFTWVKVHPLFAVVIGLAATVLYYIASESRTRKYRKLKAYQMTFYFTHNNATYEVVFWKPNNEDRWRMYISTYKEIGTRESLEDVSINLKQNITVRMAERYLIEYLDGKLITKKHL